MVEQPSSSEPNPSDPDDDVPAMHRAADRRGPLIDAALGAMRIGVGTALLVSPGTVARVCVGPGADGSGAAVFVRVVGARDVALGARIVAGWWRGQRVRPWVAAGVLSDAADLAAILVTRRELVGSRRLVVPLVAGGAGVAHALADRLGRPTLL